MKQEARSRLFWKSLSRNWKQAVREEAKLKAEVIDVTLPAKKS